MFNFTEKLSVMALEIERKFLVLNSDYRANAVGVKVIAQGYLCADPDTTVRVRIAGEQAFVTIKSRNCGAVRGEWEYEIPLADGRELLGCCGGRTVEKTRYLVPASDGYIWEVDEFGGRHAGLVVAEIELPAEDAAFHLPTFVGEEVTGNPAYYNSVLSQS